MNNLLSKTLRIFLEELEDPRKESLLRLYDDYTDLFHYALGSSHNHQAWEGGYADHLAETMRIVYANYASLSVHLRPLNFHRDEALIALFFHDIEKPFRYGPESDTRCQTWHEEFHSYEEWEDAKWAIISALEKEYGFELTQAEKHAIKYAHGEGNDHQKNKRIATPLSAFVHHCDDASARIYPEDGQGLG